MCWCFFCSGSSDLELAIALQQQEFERQQPQRHQSSTQQQEPVPQQQQQTPNQSHGTGRPGLVVGPTTARVCFFALKDSASSKFLLISTKKNLIVVHCMLGLLYLI